MSKNNNLFVPLAVQDLYIKKCFEGFKTKWLQHDLECVWYGSLQPIPDRSTYQIAIRYRKDGIPKVTIRSPVIKKSAPHRYGDNSLCLYKPDEQPWLSSQIIAHTIVPWTASWLYYYELWLDTDHWYGPEAPHDTKPKTPQSTTVRAGH